MSISHRELVEQLAQWGSHFSPDMVKGTQALFAPLVSKPDESGVSRDLHYGPDERHRLDIFAAPDASQAPVLVFVHGGGFVMGDKGGPEASYYNNVGAWAMAQGMVGVTMTYRLAPAHTWPAGRDDVTAALHWLQQHIAEYGGNPEQIFIMGQSAGATHVADVVAMGSHDHALAGAIMISGVYDVETSERNDFQKAYFGSDESRYADYSSLSGLVRSELPCLYAVCELDPPDFQHQAAALVSARVSAHERWPEMHWLPGHNHMSSVCQISTEVDNLGPHILRFIESTGARHG